MMSDPADTGINFVCITYDGSQKISEGITYVTSALIGWRHGVLEETRANETAYTSDIKIYSLKLQLQCFVYGWGVLCQKQISRAGTSDYYPQYQSSLSRLTPRCSGPGHQHPQYWLILWDVIICPCHLIVLLSHNSSYRNMGSMAWMAGCFLSKHCSTAVQTTRCQTWKSEHIFFLCALTFK